MWTKDDLRRVVDRNPQISTNENKTRGSVSNAKPERHQKATLDKVAEGKKGSVLRIEVRFTGYRTKPLDPDNFAGSVKDLLDGLRQSKLIPGDEWWQIILQTEQIKVRSKSEERTEIEIICP